MKPLLTYLVICSTLLLNGGCSINSALNQPPAIPLERAQVGASRG